METRESRMLVACCILLGLSSSALASTNLPFGTVVTGSITSPGQFNAYTFSGNANDVIDFTMVTTSGNLIPKLQLYNSKGTPIRSAYAGQPFGCGGSTLEMNAVLLPSSDTYTLDVSDCSGSNTGEYSLYAQRTNNPTGAASLLIGETQTGTVGSAADSSTYTFSANADDVFDFTMVVTSGTLIPKMRLYNPNGMLVSPAYAGEPFGCDGSTLEMNTITLPNTGTYTLLVGDCSDTNTGDYVLYAQSTNRPIGARNLPFAQVTDSTIGSAAESITYTFSGNAKDYVDFTMDTTSGSLIPKIRLYNPDGTLLSSAYAGEPFGCGGSTLEMNTVMLPKTGTYTVLVGDCADTNTGEYEIYLQRTDKPTGPVGLVFGQVQAGSVTDETQSTTYTFSGNANDHVDFTMYTASGSLIPKIRLYNPDGTLLTSAYAGEPFGCGGSTLEMTTPALPKTATYTVLIGDCADTNTGDYKIYSQRTNNPSGAVILAFAKTQSGTIGSATQSNTYIFSGNANDVVDFTMDTTTGTLIPKLRLYNPDGTLLASGYAGQPFGCGGSNLEMNTVTLPKTGTYTLLVGDCSDTNTGNYVIYAQSTNNPFGPAPVLWGQTQTASIGSKALSNTYTFSGSVHNSVNLSIIATSATLIPKMRLYNPDGTLLASAYAGQPFGCGGSTASLNSVTLPQNGKYTLLLGDCPDTNSGNYNLTSQCFGTCQTMPTITWPTPAPITWNTPLGSKQLDPRANVAGTFAFSPSSGTVLAVGPQNLSATFIPNDTTDYSTAMARVQLTVNPAPTTASITSSINPSTYGVSVRFTATVTSSAGTPTGAVTFKDGSRTLGTGALSSGNAAFSISTLSAGSHSITAVYGGSTDFAGSTSPTLTQTVNQATTSTSLTSSLNPSPFGQSVTFSATVTSSGGTPSGTVTFKDGSTSLGARTLSGGKAAFTISSLSVGTHSITVVYGGSTNFSGSTSPVLEQVVNQ